VLEDLLSALSVYDDAVDVSNVIRQTFFKHEVRLTNELELHWCDRLLKSSVHPSYQRKISEHS
jgi:hypothetical protein